MALAFGPDNRYLALTEQFVWGSRGANAYLVDLATGKILRTIPVPPDTYLIEFSPDGERLALAGKVRIDIVRVPDGTRLSSPTVAGVSIATFTPDSKSIVVGTSSTSLPQIAQSVGDEEELELRQDSCDLGRLRIFDAESRVQRVVLDRKATSSQIVFAPDGHRLVGVRDRDRHPGRRHRFADQRSGRPEPGRASYRRDSRWKRSSGKKGDVVELRDVVGNKASASLKHTQAVSVIRFSPDGSHLATAQGIESFGVGGRGKVNVFDLSTQKVVLEVPYEGGIPALSFSNDGKMLVVRLATGVIRVFALADGTEATRFGAPIGVASVAVVYGNRQILIVSDRKDDGLPQLYSRQLSPRI